MTSEAGDASRKISTWKHWTLLWLVVSAARFLYAVERRLPHMLPDEAAQLAIARRLGGGTSWSLYDYSTWQPGVGVMLSPLHWFTSDSEVIYRTALGVNATLGGAGAILLASLLLRLTDLRLTGASVVAGAIALLPSSLSASAHVWAEPMVTVVVLSTILLAIRFVECPSLARGALLTVVGAGGYLVHGRLLPLAGSVIALLVFIAAQNHGRRRLLWSVPLSVSILLLIRWFSLWVVSQVWSQPATTNSVSATLSRLSDPLAVVDAALGQTWYQLVATLGVWGIGVVVLTSSAVGRHDAVMRLPRPDDARVVALMLAPLAATSVVFMADRTESDQLVYGRYNDAVMWPLIGLGASWLYLAGRSQSFTAISRRLSGVLVALWGTGVFVHARHGQQLADDIGVAAMVSGIVPFTGDQDAIQVLRLTLLATLLALVLALGSVLVDRWRFALASVALPIVVTFGLLAHWGLGTNLNFFIGERDVRLATVDEAETLGFHFVPPDEPSWVLQSAQRRAYQLYQFYLWDHDIVIDRGLQDDVGPYVFAPREDPDLVAAGATPLWESTTTGMVLWREP